MLKLHWLKIDTRSKPCPDAFCKAIRFATRKNMKLLLHTCCAPCLIYPAEKLKDEGFQVTGFFYNPNIYPVEEYEKRKAAVTGFSGAISCGVIYPDYEPTQFLEAIGDKKESPARCRMCWKLRLKKTAAFACANAFDYFSTTLLVSPYQDQNILKELGEEAARQEGINFYFEDFRPGFRQAHNDARAKGIYCQKYCGCVYSQREQCKKSAKV